MVDSDRPITGNGSSTRSTFVVNKLESIGATEAEHKIDEELRRMDKQAIDQAWNDLHELRHHAAIDWQLYIHAMEQRTADTGANGNSSPVPNASDEPTFFERRRTSSPVALATGSSAPICPSEHDEGQEGNQHESILHAN